MKSRNGNESQKKKSSTKTKKDAGDELKDNSDYEFERETDYLEIEDSTDKDLKVVDEYKIKKKINTEIKETIPKYKAVYQTSLDLSDDEFKDFELMFQMKYTDNHGVLLFLKKSQNLLLEYRPYTFIFSGIPPYEFKCKLRDGYQFKEVSYFENYFYFEYSSNRLCKRLRDIIVIYNLDTMEEETVLNMYPFDCDSFCTYTPEIFETSEKMIMTSGTNSKSIFFYNEDYQVVKKIETTKEIYSIALINKDSFACLEGKKTYNIRKYNLKSSQWEGLISFSRNEKADYNFEFGEPKLFKFGDFVFCLLTAFFEIRVKKINPQNMEILSDICVNPFTREITPNFNARTFYFNNNLIYTSNVDKFLLIFSEKLKYFKVENFLDECKWGDLMDDGTFAALKKIGNFFKINIYKLEEVS